MEKKQYIGSTIITPITQLFYSILRNNDIINATSDVKRNISSIQSMKNHLFGKTVAHYCRLYGRVWLAEKKNEDIIATVVCTTGRDK